MLTPSKTINLIVVSLALLSGGCFIDYDLIEGTWQASESIEGYYNTLHLDETLFGEARVYFYLDDEFYYADYESAVVDVVEPSSVYRIYMSCVPDDVCGSFNFTLTCHILDEDAMECTGDSAFQEYGMFGFHRTEY